MSTTKQNNPNADFGFHAMIPRIIRTEYEELTVVQRWLYVCLKDLCGNHGTCYRSLRVLADETHLSTGMLSESIPVLHKVGLIHAEKKKRSTGGKEVWHITIVDIWAANAKAHPTKRSPREQTQDDIEENVHHVNNDVHHVNKNTKECSPRERECSPRETEVISLSNNNIEAITEKQYSNVESANADIDATHKSSPPSKNAGERTPSKENKKSNETAQPSLIEIPSGPPTIPAKDTKWTAETLVQITEAKLGKRYQEVERHMKGKLCKTQRQRQLEAAAEIIKAGFSRDEFERAYDHRNDDWWKQVKGDLTVEDMAANTARRVMRLVEELEKIANQANRKPSRPVNQGSTVQHGQRPEDYEKSPISQNNTEHLRKLLASRGVTSAATATAETKGA